MSGIVEKAAEVLNAHRAHVGPISGAWTCHCGTVATTGSIRTGDLTSHEDRVAERITHLAQALADAGLLIAAFPDGSTGTLTGDLLTDMAAYALRLKDRAETAEQAMATLREEVEEIDRNARAYGWSVGRGEPLAEQIHDVDSENPFLDPNWRDRTTGGAS